ncbi:MAG: peptidoglycan bridge formation glycyltransferase FemA/FemB family protein [Anaerolineaceae bacterium]|nr:peptidoglycan bridge formation glycyltransferase FemA/FemB family protein [Anaerolineaceae bacterium]
MITNAAEWAQFTAQHPETHLLQTAEWGELKSAFGWQPVRLVAASCGAQILFRSLPGGFTLGYIPKGPLGTNWAELLPEIDAVCREHKAIFLKVEPDHWEGKEALSFFEGKGWKHSHPIQPRRTIFVPIEGTEEQILASMKQKTRYNVHLAEKKGIQVHLSADIAAFQRMMLITGKRDGIGVHAQSYYQKAFDLFHSSGRCDLLFAEYEGRPVAGIMVFAQGKTAWYMYGASTDEERNRMPTYLLQWEAIRWARQKGCTAYDLWGVPDLDEEALEENFTGKTSHDGLWGVYRFKRGFGGQVLRSVGAWDRIYSPSIYQIYLRIMKLRGRQEE